jgi:hypothetical protein
MAAMICLKPPFVVAPRVEPRVDSDLNLTFDAWVDVACTSTRGR